MKRVLFAGARLVGADAGSFESPAPDVGRDRSRVWIGDQQLPGADPGSLELRGRWALDRERVYFDGRPIEADRASFEIIDAVFARDRDRLFADGEPVDGVPPGVEVLSPVYLRGDDGAVFVRDPRRFRVYHRREDLGDLELIDDALARRGDRLLHFGAELDGIAADLELLGDSPEPEGSGWIWRYRPGARYARAGDVVLWLDSLHVTSIPADAASFRAIGGDWAVDARRAYYRAQSLGADPKTLVALGDWARDARGVYYLGYRFEPGDPASFEALGAGFARDSRAVYIDGLEIDGADPASFRALSTGRSFVAGPDSAWASELRYGADDAHVWIHALEHSDHAQGEHTEALAGADPASFELIDQAAGIGRDREALYRGLERLDWIDAAAIELLDGGWARLGDRLLFDLAPVANASASATCWRGLYAIAEVDEPALELLGGDLARAGEAAYFKGYPLHRRWPWLEAASLEHLGGRFCRDRRRAWYVDEIALSEKVVTFGLGGGTVDLDPDQLRWLGGDYAGSDEAITFRTVAVEVRDLSTFAVLDGRRAWALDASAIYRGARIFDGDRASFTQLGRCFARDGEGAWSLETGDRIEASAANLVVEGAWARDGDRLWWAGHRLREAGEIDPEGFRALDDRWAVAGDRVLFCGRELDGAHAPSFALAGGGFAADRSAVFGSYGSVIDADRASFEVLGPGVARDREAVWLDHRRLDAIDPAALSAVGGGFFVAGDAVLCAEGVVAGADRSSFRPLGGGYAADRHGAFHGAEPLG